MAADSSLSSHDLKKQRREERERQRLEKHAALTTTTKKRSVTKYFLFSGIGLVILLLLGYFLFRPQQPNILDSFAQCLTDNDATMYGAYWCPHCANQKKLFGSSFQYATYVECDAGGKNPQPQLCLQKGVQSYPTWEINGTMVSGELPLSVLAEKSGCALPADTA